MRRTLTLLILLAALAAFSAPAALAESADRMRVAPGPVAVRENPSASAAKVRTLKAGQRVRVDYESEGWVAVFDPDQKSRAESSALGYVRLGDLRLAGPLDLRRQGAGEKDGEKDGAKAPAAEKEKAPEKKKAEKPKSAAERRREAKEAKAAAEREKREAKARKTTTKGALSRDEQPIPSSAQAKVSVRTSSVVVEKPAELKQAEAKAAEAKPAEAAAKSAEPRPADQTPAEPKQAAATASPAFRKPAPSKPVPSKPVEEDFGVIRVPDRPLAVRSARTKDSEFLKLLHPGQRVRTDFQSDGFYAVFAPEERVRDIKRAWGYGRDKYLFTEKEYAEKGPYKAPSQPAAAEQPAARPAPSPQQEAAPEAKAPAPEPKRFVPPKPEPAPEPKHQPAPQPIVEKKPAPAAQMESAPAAPGEDVVGYALVERREDALRPLAPVLVRVRLDTAAAPSQEALRRVVREIWKAERRKADEVVLEVYLAGMDTASLAYAVARFGPDGKLRELYWRDSLVPRKR